MNRLKIYLLQDIDTGIFRMKAGRMCEMEETAARKMIEEGKADFYRSKKERAEAAARGARATVEVSPAPPQGRRKRKAGKG